MSHESNTGSPSSRDNVTIPFGHKYAESENFSAVFQEGMALVEATAAYLDGDGRKEAKNLDGPASLAYASESMRLTTRLMQLASWLLIRRAVNEGEMTPEQAFEEQNKVKFQPTSSAVDEEAYAHLPLQLKELNRASLHLHRRVMALDQMLRAELEKKPSGESNPAIDEQLSRLSDAFGPMVDIQPDRKTDKKGEPDGSA